MAFHMISSAYKLNKQGDNIQPWCISFLILIQSVVPCLLLTVAFCPAYRSLRKVKMVWYSHLCKNFPQVILSHTVKGFIVQITYFIIISFEQIFFFTSRQPLCAWKCLLHTNYLSSSCLISHWKGWKYMMGQIL